ncbi:hypothetical protein O1W68_15205 [Rhodococcus sp. H36-A4]|uniref:hypothetical protein n=1 Tax=unclassified Rhodococcus (in: high G+C Gram-positive bacteria) TaxID=192944 RepID=UPI0022AFD7A4|nr:MULTISPECIES: hypothetical protein [unclassified Rhodococcus (in: high G+C Gram-positive bacteria)]MCZ4079296.1 hypothetical protein [Rhodococcus sp. H36-A4]MDJ0358911.1 hypothetical protein [Rhodococcus sp. H29-C3]
MIYLLAMIGLVAVIVLFWKAFGPTVQEPVGKVIGPDDDPEFLWKMNRDTRRSGTDGQDSGKQDQPE